MFSSARGSVGLHPTMFLLYSLMFTVGAIVAAPYYLWRSGRVPSIAHWRERFGLLPQALHGTEGGSIWVHAVSVGETLAVVGLIHELQRAFPERKIYISHVTPAGREVGESRLASLAGRFYLPLDWRWSVRSALRRLRPALLLVVETELWPNLLRAAHEFGARVVVVNARVSDRSFPGYRRVRAFMRRVLDSVDRIFAQTPTDAERFRLLGARPQQVCVAGNLKFDVLPPRLPTASQLKGTVISAQRGPVLVAASIMPGEEEFVLRAWREVRARYPRALLILAPRHPARFQAVAQILGTDAISFVRRTSVPDEGAAAASALASAEVLLLDTIGELAGIFEVADVVFVGGSLVPTGGHNLLEPAFWGKPILFGPHMENFADIAKLFLESDAAVQVCDPRSLGRAVLALLESESRQVQLGINAKRLIKRESGATQRILHYLNESLSEAAPARAAG